MAVVSPSSGRAKITDRGADLQIIIPSKKSFFLILFLTAWMGGWVMGENFAVRSLFHPKGESQLDYFLWFWLIGWTIGGAFALLGLLWLVAGREILTISNSRLVLERRIFALGTKREYEISSVKSIRVNPNEGLYANRSAAGMFGINSGSIAFDYGMKTVRFGAVDEAEASHIIEQLKNRYRLLQ